MSRDESPGDYTVHPHYIATFWTWQNFGDMRARGLRYIEGMNYIEIIELLEKWTSKMGGDK